VEFLRDIVAKLGLADRVRVAPCKVERAQGKFDVITARAVAALDPFLGMAEHLSENGTVWVVPKGKNAQSELAQAQLNWQCDALVEQSRTDPDSQILVLTRVGAKKKR
jgi:16S rRNA (guanine527-N7)-methyltransferase